MDVAEVLDPFEVGHRDAARIGIHVGDQHHALVAQHGVGAGRHRAIRRLDDQRRLDARGVGQVDDRLHRRRDQDVAIGFQHRRAIGAEGRAREILDPAIQPDPVAHRIDLEPAAGEDRAVALDDSGDDGAVFFRQELGGVIAHIAKALHDDALAFDPARKAGLGHVLGMAEELAQTVLQAAARRLDAAGDAALMQRLAGDAGHGVDVGGVHALILVDDPSHLALGGAHVGGGHVLAGVDQVALDQLIGEAAGDPLQFMLFPFARVDAEPALRAAERRLDQRAFVGHQRRQRLDLVLVDAHRIADAALDRLLMFGMHRAIAGEGVDVAAQPHPETHCIGRVADPDLLFQPRGQVHHRHGAVEHQIDGFAESRFSGNEHCSILPYTRPDVATCRSSLGRFAGGSTKRIIRHGGGPPVPRGPCPPRQCRIPPATGRRTRPIVARAATIRHPAEIRPAMPYDPPLSSAWAPQFCPKTWHR